MGSLKTEIQNPGLENNSYKINYDEKILSGLKVMEPEQIYKELTIHLCEDIKPSAYLNMVSYVGGFDAAPFSMLKALENVPQSPVHHPEGCVWKHVCLVVDQAAQVRQKSHAPTAFMWAALLHDIGKAKATRMRRGKITAYDHDTIGAKLCVEFLSQLTEDEAFINTVSMLVKYHMHPLYVLKNLPFGNIHGMKIETEIGEIALLGFCDRMGRLGSNLQEEQQNYQEFLKKCHVTS